MAVVSADAAPPLAGDVVALVGAGVGRARLSYAVDLVAVAVPAAKAGDSNAGRAVAPYPLPVASASVRGGLRACNAVRPQLWVQAVPAFVLAEAVAPVPQLALRGSRPQLSAFYFLIWFAFRQTFLVESLPEAAKFTFFCFRLWL